MGIRINKGLGWVLRGKNLDRELLTKITLQELKDEYKEIYTGFDIDFDLADLNLSQTLDSFIINAFSECEPTQVLLFIPPSMKKNWHRYDDSLDFYTKKDLVDHIEYIQGDLYPFYEKFIITSSLEKTELSELERTKATQLSDYADKLAGEEREKFISLGFDLTKPLINQIHMLPPISLRLMLAKLDPTVDYKELRPAVVTWWS